MENVIETIGLVKRYPTNASKDTGPLLHGLRGGRASSFGGILRLLRGNNGSYNYALRGVDLAVRKGEIFGVLGPNGAGKTTLIKVLCTLVIHDEGQAYVCGIDVKKQPGKVLKNLQGVLPESRGFAWRLTGLQNLEFYALLYGLREDKAKERIDYLLKFSGLDERANDLYQRYSTGMQRKLLLCRALLQDTPILLFDEPTAGLDPGSAADFRSLLSDRLARDEGKTVLLSTHNLYEAQGICDRIAILDHGRVIACDTPDNIRYKAFEEKTFSITFIDAIYNEGRIAMVRRLEKMEGVHGVTPAVDREGSLQGIELRADKNMDLSDILETVMGAGLKIATINTGEPTLEDAFMAITSRHPVADITAQERRP